MPIPKRQDETQAEYLERRRLKEAQIEAYEGEDKRYRDILRGMAPKSKRVASESKMLDAQHEAEELIRKRRRDRQASALEKK